MALPAVAYADDYVPSPTDTISCNSVTDYVAIISLQLMKDYPPVGGYPIKRTPPTGLQIEQYGHLLVIPTMGVDCSVELLDADTGASVYQVMLPADCPDCPVPSELQGFFTLQLTTDDRIYQGEILLP